MANYTGLIKDYMEFITESKKTGTFEEFAKTRLAGATKITENAKAKGGAAMLTYHHFQVKLKFYKEAAAGKFDPAKASKALEENIKKLGDRPSEILEHSPIEFQKIMGIIEVLGELLIKATH